MIRSISDLISPSPRAATRAAVAPYPGPAPFTEADGGFFFGRETAVDALLTALEHHPVVTLAGASGRGKSSLMLAGLVPRLRTARPGWGIAMVRPGSRPIEALAAALAGLHPDGSERYGSILESLLFNRGGLRDIAREWRGLLLAIDPLDALWRPDVDELAREQFLTLLHPRPDEPAPNLRAVLVLRDETRPRLDECNAFAGLAPAAHLALPEMSPEELQRAIAKPAARAGGSVEPALIERLVEAARAIEQPLPLLQANLRELWDARRRDGTLTLDAYRRQGRFRDAIARRVDRDLDAVSEEQRTLTERLVQRLVGPGGRDPDGWRRLRLPELIPPDKTPETLRGAVDPLVRAGLIATATDGRDGAVTIELAHGSLLRHWPRLGRWIDRSRDDRARFEKFSTAARRWARHRRDDAYLLEGGALETARDLDGRGALLSSNERTLLAASEARVARDREAQVWAEAHEWVFEEPALEGSQLLARLVQLAPVVAIVVALFWGLRWEQRVVAEARSVERSSQARAEAAILDGEVERLAAMALLDLAAEEPGRAALWALAGVQKNPDGRSALLERALVESDRRLPLRIVADQKASRVVVALFSPDGSRLLIGRGNGTLRLWDATTGRPIARQETPDGTLHRARWSPDGRHLFTSGEDGSAQIWNGETLTKRADLRGHPRMIYSVDWSPDGSRVVSGDTDGRVRIWRVSDGTALRELPRHKGPVAAVALSPDGHRVATADWRGAIFIWAVDDGRAIHDLKRHVLPVRQLRWSPDGRHLLSSSLGMTRLWDAERGTEVRRFEGTETASHQLAWTDSGLLVLTCGRNGRAAIWEAASGHLVGARLPCDPLDSPAGWAPDLSRLLVSDGSGRLRILDARLGTTIQQLPADVTAVEWMAWSPDGLRVLIRDSDGAPIIWSIAQSELLGAERSAAVRRAAWSPDGTRALIRRSDGTLQLFDATAGRPLWERELPRDSSRVATWSLDGVSVLVSRGAVVEVLDAESGAIILTLRGHHGAVRGAAWAPDGRHIATVGEDGTLRVWPMTGGEPKVRAVSGRGLGQVMWSPDGTQLLTTGSDGAIRLWSVEELKPAHDVQRRGGTILDLVWSPAGDHFLTRRSDGTAQLWDATTSSSPRLLPIDGGFVTALAWSDDGARVLLGDARGRVHFLDSVHGDPVRTIDGIPRSISALDLSPDGTRLLVGYSTGLALIRPVPGTTELAASLRAKSCGLYSDIEIARFMRAEGLDWSGCAHTPTEPVEASPPEGPPTARGRPSPE